MSRERAAGKTTTVEAHVAWVGGGHHSRAVGDRPRAVGGKPLLYDCFLDTKGKYLHNDVDYCRHIH